MTPFRRALRAVRRAPSIPGARLAIIANVPVSEIVAARRAMEGERRFPGGGLCPDAEIRRRQAAMGRKEAA